MRSGLLRGVARASFLVPPVLALLIASPMALSALGPGGTTAVHALVALPFYVGLACAPGYIYAVFAQPSARRLPGPRRWWVRLSLIGATLCAAAGVAGGLMMIFFTPPSLVVLIATLYLLWDFERRGRDVPRAQQRAA
jgi:hypothetical protein